MKIPTLKFTVKRDCEALNKGRNTLETLKSTSRFGVKIVKISEVRPRRAKGKKDDFPDRESQLEDGFQVWILPHLSARVWLSAKDNKILDENQVWKVFLTAYELENIYTIDATKRNAVKVPAGDKDGRSDTERVLQADLRGFMNEFSLDDEDLELEKFACYAAEPFCKYELETAASFCTFPYAKKRLEEEMDPQVLDRLRKKGRVELLALNMRHHFGVSPVAVMHQPNRNDEYLVEIPETVWTILHPNDHLVFLESDVHTMNEIKESMQMLNKGIREWKDHELEGGGVVREVLTVEKVDLPESPTRRGRGGSKS